MTTGPDPMMMMFVTFCGVFASLMGGGIIGAILGTLVAPWLGITAGILIGLGGTVYVTLKMQQLLK